MATPSQIELKQLPLWGKLRAKRLPLSFEIEITARCNHNCRHCYINLPPNDPMARARELSVAETADLASQAVQLGAVWCLISGGEPLLRADFADLYLALKRAGLLVSIFTNATLVNEDHTALLREFPARDIEVTVYGVTRTTYERVTRTPGAFDRFQHGLGLLMQSGARVRLKAMAMQSNFAEHAAIADFCRAHTTDYFRFDPQLHLRFDRDPHRNAEILTERLAPEQVVALEQADSLRMGALRSECDTLIRRKACHPGCDHLFHCGAGFSSFTIGHDGRFRLCSSLWASGTVYDLRQGTLFEAWHDFVPRLRAMRSQKPGQLKTCRQCRLINLCLWCPAHAHLETGELEGFTPYFCTVAHARAHALCDNLTEDGEVPAAAGLPYGE
jgi:radical SAM protein with 4Fe4S-binding SPASM domain